MTPRKTVAQETLDALRHIARLTLLLGKVKRATLDADGDPESDTTHTTMLTLCTAVTPTGQTDPTRILLFALVHDLVEALAGDVCTLGGLSEEDRIAKDSAEKEALETIRKDLPALATVIDSYERNECAEAQIVHVLDKTMPKLTHFNNGCLALLRRNMSYEDLRTFLRDQRAALGERCPKAGYALEVYDEASRQLLDLYKPLWKEHMEKNRTFS